MRFRGGGIGHKATNARMGSFDKDTHILPASRDDADELPDDGIKQGIEYDV